MKPRSASPGHAFAGSGFRERWSRFSRACLPSLLVLAARAEPLPPGHFPTTAEWRGRMAELVRQFPEAVRLEVLASTDLPVIVVGRLPETRRPEHPALLILGGIEPNDLAGPVGALSAVEALMVSARTNETSRRVLESSTVFVVPSLSGTESAWHVPPREERLVAGGPPVDADHDGLVDEDGAEDLDGDGRITSMRVQDPAGEYLLDPAEPRLLLKADRARGEVGAWRPLGEGIDNDGDEQWNEDGPGGVGLNRNFSAGFRFFEPGSGANPMSEPATRALADFVIARPNIAVTFTFGAPDNLTEAPKAEPGGKRPATAIQEADLPWIKELGSGWRKALKLEKEQPGVPGPGSFSDWMYYHRGRLSLAARPWFPALALDFLKPAPVPASAEAKPASGPAPATNTPVAVAPATAIAKPTPKPEPDKRNEDERAYLRWLDTHAPSSFVPWKKFTHPDFPGKTVEIGGFAPWAKSNPPESMWSELTRRQAGFLVDLAGRLPRIGVRSSEVKARGNGVFDLRVVIENTGYLPTVLAQGETTRAVLPTRVVLALEEASVLSGSRVQKLRPIPGSGGSEEVRWVVLAPGRANVEVEVISALAGRVKTSLVLKEESR